MFKVGAKAIMQMIKDNQPVPGNTWFYRHDYDGCVSTLFTDPSSRKLVSYEITPLYYAVLKHNVEAVKTLCRQPVTLKPRIIKNATGQNITDEQNALHVALYQLQENPKDQTSRKIIIELLEKFMDTPVFSAMRLGLGDVQISPVTFILLYWPSDQPLPMLPTDKDTLAAIPQLINSALQKDAFEIIQKISDFEPPENQFFNPESLENACKAEAFRSAVIISQHLNQPELFDQLCEALLESIYRLNQASSPKSKQRLAEAALMVLDKTPQEKQAEWLLKPYQNDRRFLDVIIKLDNIAYFLKAHEIMCPTDLPPTALPMKSIFEEKATAILSHILNHPELYSLLPARDDEGRSVLMQAATYGNVEFCQDYPDDDVNQLDPRGLTALSHAAIGLGSIEEKRACIQELQRRNASNEHAILIPLAGNLQDILTDKAFTSVEQILESVEQILEQADTVEPDCLITIEELYSIKTLLAAITWVLENITTLTEEQHTQLTTKLTELRKSLPPTLLTCCIHSILFHGIKYQKEKYLPQECKELIKICDNKPNR